MRDSRVFERIRKRYRDLTQTLPRWLRILVVVLVGLLGSFSTVFLIVMGIFLVSGERSSAGLEGDSPDLPSLLVGGVLLAVSIVVGFLGVSIARIGDSTAGTAIAVPAALVVVVFAGAEFSHSVTAHCGEGVSFRTGVAQSLWVAADVVPLLKVDDTLGWQEPLPATIFTDGADGSRCPSSNSARGPGITTPAGTDVDPPFSWWGSALAVRAIVVFVVLALLSLDPPMGVG